MQNLNSPAIGHGRLTERDLHRVVMYSAHTSTCVGDCSQGRKVCPCPQACEQPEYEDRPDVIDLFIVAIGLILSAAVMVLAAHTFAPSLLAIFR